MRHGDEVTIRRLASEDLPRAAPLMAELGYPVTERQFAQRFDAVIAQADGGVLVAEKGAGLLGLIAFHSLEMLHKPGRLGRITALVVTESARGRDVGTALLEAAENHLKLQGCILLEVMSAERRSDAHAFYAARGYRETRVRFVKPVAA